MNVKTPANQWTLCSVVVSTGRYVPPLSQPAATLCFAALLPFSGVLLTLSGESDSLTKSHKKTYCTEKVQ